MGRGLGAFGGFVIPPLLGGMVSAYGMKGYATGFVVFVALAGLSIVFTLILTKVRGHHPA